METAIPVERKPLFRGMETDHQCAYHVVMRFAQIHYGRSVYDPVQRDSAIAQHESQPDEHRSQLRCFAP